MKVLGKSFLEREIKSGVVEGYEGLRDFLRPSSSSSMTTEKPALVLINPKLSGHPPEEHKLIIELGPGCLSYKYTCVTDYSTSRTKFMALSPYTRRAPL